MRTGTGALYANTTGSDNTASGVTALQLDRAGVAGSQVRFETGKEKSCVTVGERGTDF